MPAQFSLNPQIIRSVPLFSSFSDAQVAQLLRPVADATLRRRTASA